MLNNEFLEKLVLLFLTALLSGFFIPFILKQIEQKKTLEQKRREAKIARQMKLIDAQSAFLEKISLAIWKWRYVFIRVTYYGAQENIEAYNAAWKDYSDCIWETLNQIRYQISCSRWIVSEAQYGILLGFYYKIIGLDKELFFLQSLNDPQKLVLELSDLNRLIFEDISVSIDMLLSNLAIELMLSAETQIEKM